MSEAIKISQNCTDMLNKLWGKFMAVQQKAQQEHGVFMEFLEYVKTEHKIPANYVLANDVKSFVPSAEPAPAPTAVVVEPETKPEDTKEPDAPVAPELTDKNINELNG